MCCGTAQPSAIFNGNHPRRMQKYPTVAESNWRANTRASLGSTKNRRVCLSWPRFRQILEKVPPNPLQSVNSPIVLHVLF